MLRRRRPPRSSANARSGDDDENMDDFIEYGDRASGGRGAARA